MNEREWTIPDQLTFSWKSEGICYVSRGPCTAKRCGLTGRIRANSLMLYGIRDKHDVFLLSAERRECLKLVLMAADFLVESIGAGGQAKDAEYGASCPLRLVITR